MPQKKQSVYSKIAQDILKKIKNDIYPIGSMLPPERELMEIYKVERTTVRRGLMLLQNDGHIKKVAGLGSVVMSKDIVPAGKDISSGYGNAPSTAVSRATSLLALLPDSDEKSRISGVIDSLKELCADNGVKFTVLESDKKERIAEVCKRDGITCCAVFFGTSDNNLQFLRESGISVCFAFCKNNGRCILPDIQGSCKAALQHLSSLGHTSIAFIGTDEDSYCQREYRVHFTDEVLKQNPDSEIEQFTNIGGNDEKSGFDRLSELIRRSGGKFSAVVTAGDKAAVGALKAAKYYRYSVPEDISVISLCGFDKDKTLTSLRCESFLFAKEIFNGCVLCPDTDYSVITSIPFILSQGTTCSKAKDVSASSKRLSDFLL